MHYAPVRRAATIRADFRTDLELVRNLDTEALLLGALEEVRTNTGDEPTPHLLELHRRGSREIFERAFMLSQSSVAEERTLAVRILRELGGSPPRFAAETLPRLAAMLEKERNPDVLVSLISAVGNQCPELSSSKSILPMILGFANHENDLVRFAVAASIPNLVDHAQPDPAAVHTLLQLTRDANSDARYYALAALTDDFALTSRKDVLQAIQGRATDSDAQIRSAVQRVLRGGTWAE